MSSFNSLSGGGRPYVNGQLQQANNFTIDGVDTNEAINNSIAYQPSPDAVEQVSVETNNYSAELGNVTGAVVNMVIKSGTNQIRGNGFYYWRDNSLAATPWATNRAGGTKSEYTRDIFGGTLGGPLMRNKLFFFADYQGGRQETPPTSAFATVVPDAWRQGDLSSLLARATRCVRDPVTGLPFPNNQIPVTRFSALARNLFADESLYPRANVARPMSDFRRELPRHDRLEGGRRPVRREGRLECVVQGQDVRAVFEADRRVRHVANGDASSVSRRRHPTRSWSVAGNWNRIFGGSIVNDLLVGYSRSDGLSDELDPLGLGELNNRYGIPGDQTLRGLTQIQMDNDDIQRRRHRDRHRQFQSGLAAERTSDLAARASHPEVRRFLELLPQQVVLSGEQRSQRVHLVHVVQLHRISLCRLPARPGVPQGERFDVRRVDAPAESRQHICRG